MFLSSFVKVIPFRFSKDKKGLVFDVSSDCDDLILEKWFNKKSLEMKIIEELN